MIEVLDMESAETAAAMVEVLQTTPEEIDEAMKELVSEIDDAFPADLRERLGRHNSRKEVAYDEVNRYTQLIEDE